MIAGKAKSTRIAVTKVAQQKRGIRLKVMPGARILRMVTTKFSAPAIDATPRICRPITQKSVPDPLYWFSVSGAYPNQPTLGAPPMTKERFRKMPPKR